MDPAPDDPTPSAKPVAGELVKRHGLATRVWHWVNAVALVVMLMSGLMIFNAHPRLYWGQYGANPDPAWFEIGARGERGFARLGPLEVTTTGVLGVWRDHTGAVQRRAFPHWATIPSNYSLADARIWHLAFAWLLALGLLGFMIVSLFNRHFQRDLTIGRTGRPGSPAGRAPAGLQACQVCHADRGARADRQFASRQGRLLGRSRRLCLVCGDLTA